MRPLIYGKNISKLLILVLCFYTFASAAAKPDDYPVTIHVSSSRWVMEPTILGGPQPVERLNVIIDGKKYELEAAAMKANREAGMALLALGDYKAKLVQNQHNTAYESSQIYEFVFPDSKTRKFYVVGQTE